MVTASEVIALSKRLRQQSNRAARNGCDDVAYDLRAASNYLQEFATSLAEHAQQPRQPQEGM
jgi:hypothetical protein